MYVYPIVARQRIGKNVTAETNTPNNKELLDASVSIRTVSYERRVCGPVYISPNVAMQQPSKMIPAAKNNCWRCRLLYGPYRIKGK
jgi:hypothetical protein